MTRWMSLSFAALLVVAAPGRAPAQPADTGHGEERFNTRLVGAQRPAGALRLPAAAGPARESAASRTSGTTPGRR